MAVGDGSSWVTGFTCTRANFNRTGPTSFGNYSVQGYDTNGGVASFTGANSGSGITGSSTRQNYTAELLAAVA